jgi:HSP20 family protein
MARVERMDGESREEVRPVTTLVRHTLPDPDVIERRFRRMFDGFTLMPAFVSPGLPAADVYDTPEEFVVELELPGYEEDDLGVEISDRILTIAGTRSDGKDEDDKAYRLRERLERTFERRFVLPAQVDTEHLAAEFTRGVLKVHAPKLAAAKQRTIAISG